MPAATTNEPCPDCERPGKTIGYTETLQRPDSLTVRYVCSNEHRWERERSVCGLLRQFPICP